MVTTPWYGQRGEFEPDPFTYDPPKELRGKLALYFENRVKEAARDILGGHDEDEFSEGIERWLLEAFGKPELPYGGDFPGRYQNFIYTASPDACIRAVEVIANCLANLWFAAGSRLLRDSWGDRTDNMIRDINALFLRYQCGYQAETSQGEPFIRLIRTDSEFLHVETVRRPLSLLREAELSEAAKQFEDAVREWSEENYADAITDANSAVETVMKFILKKDSGTASQLIKQLSKRGYLPPYMTSGVTQLADLMEMLPRLRDAESDAHGRLQIRQEQLPNYARLAINLAGSLIVFLVEEWKRRKPQDTKA